MEQGYINMLNLSFEPISPVIMQKLWMLDGTWRWRTGGACFSWWPLISNIGHWKILEGTCRWSSSWRSLTSCHHLSRLPPPCLLSKQATHPILQWQAMFFLPEINLFGSFKKRRQATFCVVCSTTSGKNTMI